MNNSQRRAAGWGMGQIWRKHHPEWSWTIISLRRTKTETFPNLSLLVKLLDSAHVVRHEIMADGVITGHICMEICEKTKQQRFFMPNAWPTLINISTYALEKLLGKDPH